MFRSVIRARPSRRLRGMGFTGPMRSRRERGIFLTIVWLSPFPTSAVGGIATLYMGSLLPVAGRLFRISPRCTESPLRKQQLTTSPSWNCAAYVCCATYRTECCCMEIPRPRHVSLLQPPEQPHVGKPRGRDRVFAPPPAPAANSTLVSFRRRALLSACRSCGNAASPFAEKAPKWGSTRSVPKSDWGFAFSSLRPVLPVTATCGAAALTAGVTSAASPGEPPARSPAAKKRASGGRRRPFEEMGEKSQKRARQVAQILDPGLKEVSEDERFERGG